MKGGKQPRGYTIVEVMIVLAVSGFMFVVASQFINGRHEKATFTAGVSEMAARIQDTIEQVTNGQYSDVPINCTFSGGVTGFSGPPNPQGTNADCVFLGKILHFAESGPGWSAASNPQHYETLLVAGGRIDPITLQPITNLPSAHPEIIPPLVKQQVTSQSLEVRRVRVNGVVDLSYGIGFFQGQGGLDANNNLQNGTSPVKLYYVQGLTSGQDTNGAKNRVHTAANLIVAQSVDICVTDTQQSAEILIGLNGGSSQLSVNVKKNGAVPCP